MLGSDSKGREGEVMWGRGVNDGKHIEQPERGAGQDMHSCGVHPEKFK